MRLKLGHCFYGILAVAFIVDSAWAGVPPGLREALAEFETGAKRAGPCAADAVVGSRQEISRFQILPSVWRLYSASREFRDPDTAWAVTEKILRERERQFQRATGRDWDEVDLYLMWNAPGLYERAQWQRGRISRVVLERARRFGNLMEKRSAAYLAQR